MQTTTKHQVKGKHGGPRPNSGRRPLAVKKEAFYVYLYPADIELLGGAANLKARLENYVHTAAKKLKA